jgi:hypothetical protein
MVFFLLITILPKTRRALKSEVCSVFFDGAHLAFSEAIWLDY